jgi:hypothetical protein
MGWGHLQISKAIGRILTRLIANHPWGEGIQVCTDEWGCSSPMGYNNERVKVH